MKPVPRVIIVAAAIVGFSNSAAGTVVATSDFNQLQSGHFGGYASGIDSRLPPLTIDGVTFTFTPSGSSGQHNGGVSFPFTAASSGSDPAVQAFFGRPFSGPPETFIDFSQPLYAFGVTFIVGGGSFPEDGLLQVYDGPGGTGNLIGSVVGSPPPAPWSASNRPVDFVALISDQLNIRSAEVVGAGDPSVYWVAGLGYATVPEPSTIALMFAALYALLAGTRRIA